MTPYATYPVKPYAAEAYPKQFEQPEIQVISIKPERTFWEKVTILHAEAHRPPDKSQPARYSRHYYDVYKMLDTDIEKLALSDMDLLDDVVSFKKRFYHSGWASYDTAVPGTMRLVPDEYRLGLLKSDYAYMREMIFGDYPKFDTIIEKLKEFENKFNPIEG